MNDVLLFIQIVAAAEAGVIVSTGNGFTVTTDAEKQPLGMV